MQNLQQTSAPAYVSDQTHDQSIPLPQPSYSAYKAIEDVQNKSMHQGLLLDTLN